MKTGQQLIETYSQSGLLIDTNILLLYIVGSVRKELVPTFNRTSRFAVEDFDTLVRFLTPFHKTVTTPNILTEVSNLLRQISPGWERPCFEKLAGLIRVIDEHYIASIVASGMDSFGKFGLTDAAIVAMLAKDKYLVLTDDFALSQYLTKKGVDAVNFNNVRVLAWK